MYNDSHSWLTFPTHSNNSGRVEFLPEEMTFFRTGGRKWKKLISSAEDLEESEINGI